LVEIEAYDFSGAVNQIRGKVASASLAGLNGAPEIELGCNSQTTPKAMARLRRRRSRRAT
jgi:hypothetical protein